MSITKKHKIKARGQMAFFVLVCFFILAFLFKLPRVTIPLSISYLLYLVINPTIPLFMKIGLSRTLTIIVVFANALFFTTYPIIKFAPDIKKEAENIQYYFPKVESFLIKNYEKLKVQVEDRTNIEVDDKYIGNAIDYGKKAITSFILNVPKTLASVIEWIFLIPLFLFFMLKDSTHIRRIILKITPNGLFERFYYLFHQFNKQLGDYIFAKCIEAVIVGVLITSGLLIIGVKFSLILGLVAGVTNVIPYLGPLLGMIPGLIYAVAEYGTGPTFGAVAILYLTANAIDIGIVFPLLVSKIVDLHPILVVVSVIIGSQYLGVVGMVISIPCAAAMKLIVIEIYNEFYLGNHN